MSSLSRVTLHLARDKAHPDGSSLDGYSFVAPLGADHRIDVAAFERQKGLCRVHRFRRGEDERVGVLRHRAGGAGGATWFFDYDTSGESDDEAAHRFADHAFVPGEYLSIREDDGELLTFKVVSVTPA